MDRLNPRPRADARRLRAIERGLSATDAAWAWEVFGDVARPRAPS
ncbi:MULTISPECIES: hypothetical protein [Amycolatopsis]|nr:hypothetical protein [Amycolatopsis bullii]